MAATASIQQDDDFKRIWGNARKAGPIETEGVSISLLALEFHRYYTQEQGWKNLPEEFLHQCLLHMLRYSHQKDESAYPMLYERMCLALGPVDCFIDRLTGLYDKEGKPCPWWKGYQDPVSKEKLDKGTCFFRFPNDPTKQALTLVCASPNPEKPDKLRWRVHQRDTNLYYIEEFDNPVYDALMPIELLFSDEMLPHPSNHPSRTLSVAFASAVQSHFNVMSELTHKEWRGGTQEK